MPAFPGASLDAQDFPLVLTSAGGIHSWAPLYKIGENSRSHEEEVFQVTGYNVEAEGDVIRIRVTFSQAVSSMPPPSAAVEVTSQDGEVIEAKVSLSSDPSILVIEIEREGDGSVRLRIVGETLQSEEGQTLNQDWEAEIAE